MKNNKNAVSMV